MNDFLLEGQGEITVSSSTAFLCFIAAYSFMTHLMMTVFSGLVYIAVLLLLTLVYIFNTGICRIYKSNLLVLIGMATGVVLLGYVRSGRNDALIDFTVMLCGWLLTGVNTNDDTAFCCVLKVIICFAVFFSVGVLLHALLPGIHKALVNFFPSEFAAAIVSGSEVSKISCRGFTTNSGHAAGYICAGILSVLAGGDYLYRKKRNKIFLLGILFTALFFTGKRGPALFLVLTVIMTSLALYHGSRKIKIYLKAFIAISILMLVYVIFHNYLERIPLVKEIGKTLEGLAAGEDVSSSRISLYAWAVKLFGEHPLLGIGWGKFRTTVVGNVTRVKALDTHNIYLQLLAETGIAGFTVFMVMFIVMWAKTKNVLAKLHSETVPSGWYVALEFSLMYQTFFLLYGLSGNTLYDQHYQILYFISYMIVMAYQNNSDCWRIRYESGNNNIPFCF